MRIKSGRIVSQGLWALTVHWQVLRRPKRLLNDKLKSSEKSQEIESRVGGPELFSPSSQSPGVEIYLKAKGKGQGASALGVRHFFLHSKTSGNGLLPLTACSSLQARGLQKARLEDILAE
jgi:hypothetical protein